MISFKGGDVGGCLVYLWCIVFDGGFQLVDQCGLVDFGLVFDDFEVWQVVVIDDSVVVCGWFQFVYVVYCFLQVVVQVDVIVVEGFEQFQYCVLQVCCYVIVVD